MKRPDWPEVYITESTGAETAARGVSFVNGRKIAAVIPATQDMGQWPPPPDAFRALIGMQAQDLGLL